MTKGDIERVHKAVALGILIAFPAIHLLASAKSPPPSWQTAIVAEAQTLLGTPYRHGGQNPQGFDCSGLSAYLYGRVGVSLPRTSVAQSKVGRLVAVADIQRGDLLFFAAKSVVDAKAKRVSHVGVALDATQFVHASSSAGVRLSTVDSPHFRGRFVHARRVLD